MRLVVFLAVIAAVYSVQHEARAAQKKRGVIECVFSEYDERLRGSPGENVIRVPKEKAAKLTINLDASTFVWTGFSGDGKYKKSGKIPPVTGDIRTGMVQIGFFLDSGEWTQATIYGYNIYSAKDKYADHRITATIRQDQTIVGNTYGADYPYLMRGMEFSRHTRNCHMKKAK